MASNPSTVDRHCSGPRHHHHHHQNSSSTSTTETQSLGPDLQRSPSNTMTESTTSATYTHSSNSSYHPYLGDRQLNAIESWKTSVQAKSTCPMRVAGEDPVIEAYLQTKMALFRSLAGVKDGEGGVGGESSPPDGECR
ncbi:hypothetical protein M409DRAFT_57478 [Zasmidium cellare ATCC 36951]|uniref:Uncharacterized protein n=1 Tax=Zasmidium cellare ATCC 36951 TaxID=1080233 RepID=A0A6A6CBL9_ZASCE|nr:uncharacterized protein M409DRAFT_57478 [Zasmidium cellare ATCC 36951]KAF2163598.1 hypothetical protein M409DRAFT_57478 [Zasmidium cellare ATCC 36951]